MVVKIKVILRRLLFKLLWIFLSPLLRRLSSPNRVILTCTRGDGGGAQWHGRFSVMAFADRHDMGYLPSNFDRIMPEDTGELRNLWSELFVGEFIDIQRPKNYLKADSLVLLSQAVISSFLTGKTVLIDAGHLHAYTDLYPESVSEAIRTHKIRYNNPAGISLDPYSEPVIAMHVRRGLSWETNFTPNRLTSDKQVLGRLNYIRSLTGVNAGTVFSAVANDNLSSNLPQGLRYDHTSDEFTVIHNLIHADVTILAKSCMSYIAGAFSEGEVFYDPFFHPPLPGWRAVSLSD